MSDQIVRWSARHHAWAYTSHSVKRRLVGVDMFDMRGALDAIADSFACPEIYGPMRNFRGEGGIGRIALVTSSA